MPAAEENTTPEAPIKKIEPGLHEKSPAFQLYPKDILSDGNAMAMPLEAFGAYMKLLCYDWIDDGIPDDAIAWRRLCGYEHFNFQGHERDIEDWDTIASYLRPRFVDHPTKSGYLTNPRLQKEREKQKQRSAAAQESANVRWQNKRNANAMRTQCFSSSSSSSSSNKKEEEREEGADAPSAPAQDSKPERPKLHLALKLHPSPKAPRHLKRKTEELIPFPDEESPVFLTQTEIRKLIARFKNKGAQDPEYEMEKLVNQLDLYSANKKFYNYVDHYRTLWNWANRDEAKQRAND